MTLFRRSPLAIALLAKATWREATLARLRDVPRGVGVSENMKARAFFRRINEIALEALDEARSQRAIAARRILRQALLGATLVLNCLVLFGYERRGASRASTTEATRVMFDDQMDAASWWGRDRELEFGFLSLDVAPSWYEVFGAEKLVLDFGRWTRWFSRTHLVLAFVRFGVALYAADADDDDERRKTSQDREAREGDDADAPPARHVQGEKDDDDDKASVASDFSVRGSHLPNAGLRIRARRYWDAAKVMAARHLGMPGFALVCSILGNFHSPLWYSITLAPYLRSDKTVSFVTRALRLSSANIARILAFMGVCMFAVSGFVFLAFARVECDSVWQCFEMGAARRGNGFTNAILGLPPFVQPDEYTNLGDVPLYPLIASRQLHLWQHWASFLWVAVNVVCFVFFVLLFQALITGIILNEFTAMYMDQQMLKIDLRECCLVCSLTADRLERAGHDFRYHTRHDHDPLEYVSLAISLREWWQKGTRTFTHHETYALTCLLRNRPQMLPVHTCFALREDGGPSKKDLAKDKPLNEDEAEKDKKPEGSDLDAKMALLMDVMARFERQAAAQMGDDEGEWRPNRHRSEDAQAKFRGSTIVAPPGRDRGTSLKRGSNVASRPRGVSMGEAARADRQSSMDELPAPDASPPETRARGLSNPLGAFAGGAKAPEAAAAPAEVARAPEQSKPGSG